MSFKPLAVLQRSASNTDNGGENKGEENPLRMRVEAEESNLWIASGMVDKRFSSHFSAHLQTCGSRTIQVSFPPHPPPPLSYLLTESSRASQAALSSLVSQGDLHFPHHLSAHLHWTCGS